MMKIVDTSVPQWNHSKSFFVFVLKASEYLYFFVDIKQGYKMARELQLSLIFLVDDTAKLMFVTKQLP